jgi:hypothetical protein
MHMGSVLRASAALCVGATLLGGCDFLAGTFRAGDPPADGSEAVYRAAMTEFSDCGVATDPSARAASAARLAEAAATLQAEARPTNPDHFYMADRVSAAAAYCAELAGTR